MEQSEESHHEGVRTSLNPVLRLYDEDPLSERELLSRLLSILQSASIRDRVNTQGVQTSPVDRHSIHSTPRSQKRGTVRRSFIGTHDSEGLSRVSRVPRLDPSEKLKAFERKSLHLQNTLEKMSIFFSEIDDATTANATIKLAVNLRGVTGYLHQHIERLVQADIGPPFEVYANNLASALITFSQSSQALSDIMRERTALILGGSQDEPFLSLIKLTESEAQYLKENNSNKRMSGIRFRHHTFEMLVQLTTYIGDCHLYLSKTTKIIREVYIKRWEADYNRATQMISIFVLISILVAILLSLSTLQSNGSLRSAVEAIWLVTLICTVVAMFVNVAESLTKRGILEKCQHFESIHISLTVSQLFTTSGDALLLSAIFLSFVGLILETYLLPQATISKVIVTAVAILQFTMQFVIGLWFFCAQKRSSPTFRSVGVWSKAKGWAQVPFRPSSIVPPVNPPLGTKDIEHGNMPRRPGKAEPPIIQVTEYDDQPPFPTREPYFDPLNVASQVNPPKETYEGSNSTHVNQSAMSHGSNLDVPSVQQPSSEDGRSLPPLPTDVHVVSCLAYSPNGCFLCIGNSSLQEYCSVISTDAPGVSLGQIKLTDIAQQIEWSSDSERVLLRLTHTTYVWNVLPSKTKKRNGILINQEADIAKWHPQLHEIFLCKRNVISRFDPRGMSIGAYQIPNFSIQDFIITRDGNRAIVLTADPSYDDIKRPKRQMLISFNFKRRMVEQMVPVGRGAVSLKSSNFTRDHIIVNFVGNMPPHVWRYETSSEAQENYVTPNGFVFERAFGFRLPSYGSSFSGNGIFGTPEDKYILSFTEDGDVFIFNGNTGFMIQHMQILKAKTLLSESKMKHISSSRLLNGPVTQSAVWDPDGIRFTVCMGFMDGSVWQWKISTGCMSDEGMVVAPMQDEEATLMRPGNENESQVQEITSE